MSDDEDLIDDVMTFEATTKDISVAVQSFYIDDQSEPDEGRFVWAYRVRIDNGSDRSVQLLTRRWVITDAHGSVKEVSGKGVIGEQPLLEPGEYFVYTSGTPLSTPTGFMSGSYGMKNGEGEHFDVAIPAFSLDSPHFGSGLN